MTDPSPRLSPDDQPLSKFSKSLDLSLPPEVGRHWLHQEFKKRENATMLHEVSRALAACLF